MCAASVPDALRTPLLCAPAAPAAEGVRALPAADRTGCCLPGPPQTGAPCPRGRTHSASVGPWLCPEVGCDLQDSVLRAPALRPSVSHPLFGHLRCGAASALRCCSFHTTSSGCICCFLGCFNAVPGQSQCRGSGLPSAEVPSTPLGSGFAVTSPTQEDDLCPHTGGLLPSAFGNDACGVSVGEAAVWLLYSKRRGHRWLGLNVIQSKAKKEARQPPTPPLTAPPGPAAASGHSSLERLAWTPA